MDTDGGQSQRLLAALPDGVATWVAERDESGQVADFALAWANPAASATLDGRTSMRGDLLGEGLAPQFDEVVRTLITGSPSVLGGGPLPTSDGPGYREARVYRISTEEVAVVSRDVTALVSTTRALTEQQQRFRMAFDDAPVGMAVAGLDPRDPGRYLMVNDAYADLLGYSRERLVGMSFRQLTHPDDRDVDRVQAAEMAAGHRPLYRREKRLVRADGQVIWVRMSASPVQVDGAPRYVVTHIEDITDRRRVEDELMHRALYDPLTGMANRSLLLDRLAHALKEQHRTPGMLAVLFLDLDRFKDVNDSLGHEAGDLVLIEVAARIRGVVRGGDTAARLAGDEFVVAATVDDLDHAVRIATRLHREISAPIDLANHHVRITPSIGITIDSEDHAPPMRGAAGGRQDQDSDARGSDVGMTPQELLRRADIAMYQAKRHGVRAWEIYDDRLHRRAVQRLEIEEELQAALDENRLRLLYQPIIDLDDGSVVCAEALLRIHHPERGLLAPAHFIDVAEESHLIIAVGAWALREACVQLARWQRSRPRMQVSVNVAARQARQLVVADQVRDAVDRAGIDPHDLVVELTERVLVDSVDDVLGDLRTVVAAGCGLAIDDFGTGYSSLTYLKRFPVTSVKIDRSFVDGLGSRHHDDAIVRAVTGLARTLDLTAVAEGVETRAQLAALRDLGCHRAQGYHIGRPMTADRLHALLKA